MQIHHNYLRMCRKVSHLNQSDIAFIMRLPDSSSISRWEQGQTMPHIEVLMVYHLLFDIPIESLFERQKQSLSDRLTERIRLLLENLKVLEPSEKGSERISFLESTLARLSAPQTL